MAEQIFDNAFLSVEGTDLSDKIRSVTFSYSSETQDDTAMGDDTRSMVGGLKNWSVEVEFNQDFASGEVDATLFSKVGTKVALVLRPDAGTKSTTNPEFTGDAILTDYPPMGGSVGDQLTASATFQAAGTLSRATS
jgi:hypothetical protein